MIGNSMNISNYSFIILFALSNGFMTIMHTANQITFSSKLIIHQENKLLHYVSII